jgi:hypothetical protein
MSPQLNSVLLTSCLILISASPAWAEEVTPSKQAISIPNAYIASDSEGFSTYKYNAGYLPLYEHGEKILALVTSTITSLREIGIHRQRSIPYSPKLSTQEPVWDTTLILAITFRMAISY